MDLTDLPVFYFALVPLVVFGPLFVWLLYNFGLRELVKLPGDIRERRGREAERLAARLRRKGRSRRVLGRASRRITASGWVGQALAYGAFAAVIGYLSAAPAYTALPPDMAVIKLSLSHVGKRKVECRRRTRKELKRLSPNMRAPMSCSRARWPVRVELDIDGAPVFGESGAPAGLHGDGPSSFYRTFRVAAGRHRLSVRMRERGDGRGFDYRREAGFVLKRGQALAISFDSSKGEFVFE